MLDEDTTGSVHTAQVHSDDSAAVMPIKQLSPKRIAYY